MVGKPNLPVDAEERKDVHGAARTTPGLSALDEEREASMADEGGTSGMAAESERPRVEVDEFAEPGLGFDLLLVGGVFALGALAGVVLTRTFNRS
ncbi:MAG TPA: hypothetical protein VFO85_02460 [Vicinamibacteria bacterium]|nr:hypothetical protein [Vicinamibacteria bacterium]